MESIPSESECYPAKLAHGHVQWLIDHGVRTIFHPCVFYEHQETPGAQNHFNCPIVVSYPENLKNNVDAISEDGVITEYVQDTLDESYYSASELEKMITSDVADYNSKHGENTIQVKSYEASDDGKVHLVMEYATADDYALFNM